MNGRRWFFAVVVATTTAAFAQAALTDGEVRRIDKDAAKLTLRHGRIENLDMPPMTMVFRVADPKLLDGLQEGDRVRFRAERIGGVFTVTAVEPQR